MNIDNINTHNNNHNNDYPNGYNHKNDYYYNNTGYRNFANDEYYMNCGFGFLFIFFIFLSCYKSRRDYINHQNNERNQRLITNNTSSSDSTEINTQNIEKIEIQFKNNLYQNECTICLENFNENEILYELSCKHYYHKDCIDDWLSKKNTCPLCRLNLL